MVDWWSGGRGPGCGAGRCQAGRPEATAGAAEALALRPFKVSSDGNRPCYPEPTMCNPGNVTCTGSLTISVSR